MMKIINSVSLFSSLIYFAILGAAFTETCAPQLGEAFPDISADSTNGPIHLHEYLGKDWGLLISYPADFTPVCTSELARVVKILQEFVKRDVKVLGISPNSVATHRAWSKDILEYAKVADTDHFPYPIMTDEDLSIAKHLNMLDKKHSMPDGSPLMGRAVFLISPERILRLSLIYPATTGRNFNEIIRSIDAIQLAEKLPVATPVDWKSGDSIMIHPGLPEDKTREMFPETKTVNLPSGKTYMRLAPQP
ncbi:PREDICTED: peroxiredoxin-6-like [Nicrophorus vespilloides]|uniref:thioredoxin-dependent peroxiredoxin n=1 Tax=Nicrophorus vespilloides TaxID=110193 RepID=A0ABM1M5L5_NICVS|nr:PREDICTED: peroxiredoxin-6-like [Nicrophorus vespilloides]